MDDGKVPWADGREAKGKTVICNNMCQYRMGVTVSCYAGLLHEGSMGRQLRARPSSLHA